VAYITDRDGAVGRWRGDVADDVGTRAAAFLLAEHDVLVGPVTWLDVPVASTSRRAVMGGERRLRPVSHQLGVLVVALSDDDTARDDLMDRPRSASPSTADGADATEYVRLRGL
jgi:hypothetical protein